MTGWRLSKSDGSAQREGLTLAEVRSLIEAGHYGGEDLVASPSQNKLLMIRSVAALRKHLGDPQAISGTQPDVTELKSPSPEPSHRAPRPGMVDANTAGTEARPQPPSAPSQPDLSGGSAGEFRRSRSTETAADAELEISSMIDVVFQLLIFFMVCSSLNQTHGVDVPATETGIGVDPDACVIVGVQPRGKDVGAASSLLFIDNDPQPLANVTEAAQKAADRLRETNRQRIVIKAESTVHFGIIRELMQAIRKQTDAPISTGVKDKQ